MSGKHDKQKTRAEPTHTDTMRKRIIDPDLYFDGLLLCLDGWVPGVVSVRALAILLAAPIHPCDCQMILRGYITPVAILPAGKSLPTTYFADVSIFMPDEIFFCFFLFSFLSVT